MMSASIGISQRLGGQQQYKSPQSRDNQILMLQRFHLLQLLLMLCLDTG